jgi:hypothetical protein
MMDSFIILLMLAALLAGGYYVGRLHEETRNVRRNIIRERKAAQILASTRTPEDAARRLDDGSF